MPAYHVGTMGFGYREWLGPFYPPGTKAAEYLAYYARHFDAVELDTTFHAAPDRARVRKWAAAVPEHFRFTAKVPRAVTHDAPLDRGGPLLLDFISVMEEMGPKLGPILIQLPPTLTNREFPRLATLISKVPADVKLAVEFRHSSWWTPATGKLLRDYRVAWVAAEYTGEPREIEVTADFMYVRWIGEHDRFPAKNREEIDVAPRLAWWHEQLTHKAHAARDVWAFFNNDYSGYAIETGRRFKTLVGQSTEPIRDPGTLFA